MGTNMAIAALTMLTLSSLARADEKVYQQTLPSIVLVLSQTQDEMETGSGVLLDGKRKWGLTNSHVIHGSCELVVVFLGSQGRPRDRECVRNLFSCGKKSS
jgi:S1-C subfamily serine protease